MLQHPPPAGVCASDRAAASQCPLPTDRPRHRPLSLPHSDCRPRGVSPPPKPGAAWEGHCRGREGVPVSDSLGPHGLQPARLSVHGILQASTRVGGHFLLQGIFPTQGSNLSFLHCRRILYHLSHQGSLPGGGVANTNPPQRMRKLSYCLSGSRKELSSAAPRVGPSPSPSPSPPLPQPL